VRESREITTTQDLLDVIQSLAPKFKEHKFFAQVFQAIRIEVNGELDVLKKFLQQCESCLKPHGRLVALSYHSLEDRLVKNWMKRGSFDGTITKDFFGNVLKPFTEVNRHPILPTEEEMEANSRARSAKLRIAERNDG
jgi:16S rRNA (cytosine1402-N4)-methyltransferase